MTPARRPTLLAGRRAPLRGKTRLGAFSIGATLGPGKPELEGLKQCWGQSGVAWASLMNRDLGTAALAVPDFFARSCQRLSASVVIGYNFVQLAGIGWVPVFLCALFFDSAWRWGKASTRVSTLQAESLRHRAATRQLGLPAVRFLRGLGLGPSKYITWQSRWA